MEGLSKSRIPKFDTVENVVFLDEPKPAPISPITPCRPNNTTKYVPETPPRPVQLPPAVLRASLESPAKSPSRSPFARYTKKQNTSLLSVLSQTNLSSPKLPPIKIPSPIHNTTTTSPNNEEHINVRPDEELDEYGFYIETSKHLFNMCNKKPLQKFSATNQEWEKIISSKKQFNEISTDLLHQGIPKEIRKEVWKYFACLHENNKLSGMKTTEKINSSNDPISAATMEYLHLKNLSKIDNPNDAQILLDISRTFPSHHLYTPSNQEGQSKLYNVLLAYSNYNKKIGYCQGMSYIAGLLLMYMDEPEAFWLFEWILQDCRLGENYTTDMSGLMEFSSIFDELLQIHFPLVFKVLQKSGIHPLMYVTSWFMTLFTQLNSWSTVLHFFDLLFYYGPEEALFRFALALVHVCQSDILSFRSLEGLLPYLQSIPVERCNDPLLIPLCCSYPMKHILENVKAKIERQNEKLEGKQFDTTPLRQKPQQLPSRPKRRVANPQPIPKETIPIQTEEQPNSVYSFFDRVINTFTTPKKQPPSAKKPATSSRNILQNSNLPQISVPKKRTHSEMQGPVVVPFPELENRPKRQKISNDENMFPIKNQTPKTRTNSNNRSRNQTPKIRNDDEEVISPTLSAFTHMI